MDLTYSILDFLIVLTLGYSEVLFLCLSCFSVLFRFIMPQLRGSCGHVKGEWDPHRSCMSCTGCSPSCKCSFCQEWLSATRRKAMNHRTFQSRKPKSRSSQSCSRGSGSVMSGRRGEVRVSLIFPRPLLTSGLLATCLIRPVHWSSVNLCPVPVWVKPPGTSQSA